MEKYDNPKKSKVWGYFDFDMTLHEVYSFQIRPLYIDQPSDICTVDTSLYDQLVFSNLN